MKETKENQKRMMKILIIMMTKRTQRKEEDLEYPRNGLELSQYLTIL